MRNVHIIYNFSGILVLFWQWATCAASSHTTPIVLGVDGGTESIRACFFNARDGRVVGKACAVPYSTSHPHTGWAEQDPHQWWESMTKAVRQAVQSVGDPSQHDIVAMCVDTTCCSVVALDQDGTPLRPCLLWMDARSAPQTKEILETCRGDPALAVNCNGNGPLSAEWMTPKALWIAQNEPEIWKQAGTICEYQDFINYKLTGEMVASACNAATRWHWNGRECLHHATDDEPHPGRPVSLYHMLGIPELADKLPSKCLPMGALIGNGLTAEAAAALGLPPNLPVIQGGPDAFVGMIGLGCIRPGQLCLITGSSHLHCYVAKEDATPSTGIWGPYIGAPLKDLKFAEGGQSSTGSMVRWARSSILNAEDMTYAELDNEAAAIPPGSEGLLVLETFQGSRTPETDALARGAIVGLSLRHTRAHIWRALLESVCFGTRACIQALEAASASSCQEILLAGGATRSPLWVQLHSDVTGKPVVVTETSGDAPLVGCAILAAVGVGLYASVEEAVSHMVHISQRIEPNPKVTAKYDRLFSEAYSTLGVSVRPVTHAIANIRGGSTDDAKDQRRRTRPGVIVSPSVLASDWANIEREVQRCISAGATRLHVDVFDGVFLDSPHALTFGPQMVQAIARSAASTNSSEQQQPQASHYLDLHVCVDRPARYVSAMADACQGRTTTTTTTTTTFIFQWEAMESESQAIALAKDIQNHGMQVGISINPSTPVSEIFCLLETGMISLVDVLAVEPGFGGQTFQKVALSKIQELYHWRAQHEANSFDILVDGGIQQETSKQCIQAGADILVAGTFVFSHQSISEAINELIGSSNQSTMVKNIEFTFRNNSLNDIIQKF